jgi:hypothetical protein
LQTGSFEQITLLVLRLPPAQRRFRYTSPQNDLERTASIVAALVDARHPLDAHAVAATFRQGSKVEPAIRVLASLARLGHVHTSDGATFALRRTA